LVLNLASVVDLMADLTVDLMVALTADLTEELVSKCQTRQDFKPLAELDFKRLLMERSRILVRKKKYES
jgi:hypothetical protein